MMPEISLNVLDVAENSTRAGASLVTITVDADFVFVFFSNQVEKSFSAGAILK